MPAARKSSKCRPRLISLLSPVLGNMPLQTTCAMQRYVFDKADNEYIRGSAKNPTYERPNWLNQKLLAERIFAFNKILAHFKAMEGMDGQFYSLSPAKSIPKKANFNLTSKLNLPGRVQDRDSPLASELQGTSLSKVNSMQSPVSRSRKFNNFKAALN